MRRKLAAKALRCAQAFQAVGLDHAGEETKVDVRVGIRRRRGGAKPGRDVWDDSLGLLVIERWEEPELGVLETKSAAALADAALAENDDLLPPSQGIHNHGPLFKGIKHGLIKVSGDGFFKSGDGRYLFARLATFNLLRLPFLPRVAAKITPR